MLVLEALIYGLFDLCTVQIEIVRYDLKFQRAILDKRTVSIKRTYLKIFKKSLLNVPYNLKNESIIT